MYVILGILAGLTGGLVTLFGKMGLKNVDPMFATAFRAIFVAAPVLIIATATQKWSQLHTVDAKTLWWIVLAGLCGAASWIFFFAALKLGPAAKVSALDRLSLVFAVIFAAVFLGEKIKAIGWLGAAMMTAGAILLSL